MRSIRHGNNTGGQKVTLQKKRLGPQDKITLILTRNQIGVLIALIQQRYRERYEMPPNSILAGELLGTLAVLEKAFSGKKTWGEIGKKSDESE